MSLLNSLAAPLGSVIDKVVANPGQRDKAKAQLLQLQGSADFAEIEQRLEAILAESRSPDKWTSRARPSFLYVMYALLLFALPMGVLAGISPERAMAVARGVDAYLSSLPEPLYALFGAGYLGYTIVRQWGKIAGSDR